MSVTKHTLKINKRFKSRKRFAQDLSSCRGDPGYFSGAQGLGTLTYLSILSKTPVE